MRIDLPRNLSCHRVYSVAYSLDYGTVSTPWYDLVQVCQCTMTFKAVETECIRPSVHSRQLFGPDVKPNCLLTNDEAADR